MSTWEMFKFWIIKETMPLLITLAIIAALVIGCLVWVFIESIRDKFRKKPNTSDHRCSPGASVTNTERNQAK